MSSPLSTDVLLARNKAYLPTHQPIPTRADIISVIGYMPPQIMVVTCADPRCIPETFLKLQTSEAITIRNAGGNIETALPDILALDVLLGLQEIVVIKHTDCGSLAYTDEGVKRVLGERAPGMQEEIAKMEFGSIAGKTLEQGLREQVDVVKGSGLVREDLKARIRGFVFDLASGGLMEVDV
ncbi:hypothetical protein B0A55_12413 [Friedmanniomyces simplex]|uniref:Carbonic anhydrase n=1 Tax=Friedmanniomyces simplex TaxID=329884 RepID=A0A4V5NC87_9PEZI|nr:hypothetical protein B0A55_12200 [Friedmanniomyces simplex]TKA62286.1 hypothetical protein B0A55_12413 [Friedmanniomyces simplex]